MAQPSKRNSIEWYLSNFKQLEKSLNGEAFSFIHSIRKSAIARFAELGFPTTSDEEWKYTDVSPITKLNFQHIIDYLENGLNKSDIDKFTFKNLPVHRIVCVNGFYMPELSAVGTLPEGVIITSLAHASKTNNEIVQQHFAQYADYSSNTFVALNTAFQSKGVFVFIPKDCILETPIHMIYVSTANELLVTHPRNLMIFSENTQTAIIESYVSLSNNKHFTNTVSEFVIGKNAVVEHDRLLMENSQTYHISTIQVQQERSSNFVSNAMTFGGSLVRNNVNVILDGESSGCALNGLYFGTDSQLIDNHTLIEHTKPYCTSYELYKGILADKSKGVFNGKIKVRKNAQRTNAKQTNKNLVLSDEASIDTKPQLEIFADDVKCTHGATIGKLDEESIFYLRSRGIDVEKARDMLIFAFASEIIDRLKAEPVQYFLHKLIQDKLEQEKLSKRA